MSGLRQGLENAHQRPEREEQSLQKLREVLTSMEEYLRPLLPMLSSPEARYLPWADCGSWKPEWAGEATGRC